MRFLQARPALARSIASPGAQQAQRVGTATALMHPQFEGVVRSRRSQSGSAVRPDGVARSANVWANGVYGRRLGDRADAGAQRHCRRRQLELAAVCGLGRMQL